MERGLGAVSAQLGGCCNDAVCYWRAEQGLDCSQEERKDKEVQNHPAAAGVRL